MNQISFETLPNAVSLLFDKVDSIEKLLNNLSNQAANYKPMSINEAAKFLNLSVPTIYGLVSKRNIPFFKVGKKLYFLESELIAWIQSSRKQTRSENSENAFGLTPKKTKRI